MLLAAAASATALRSGEVFAARYRIEALLGRCGGCDVYRVLDECGGERRALKCLPTGAASHGRLIWQLEREHHILSELADPCLVQVYDASFGEGSAYYTLELLEGDELHERGKLPYRDACRLLRDIATSLARLHAHGLLHRDVCPRNVHCSADDRAKLFDFGSLTRAGVPGRPIGTPAFVAPEMAQLQALDARADLFALGALLYWSLSGRNAYPARSFAQLEAAWRTPPPPPSRYAAEVPAELDALVLELLTLDRTLRPASAAWVAERLSVIAGLESRVPSRARALPLVPNLIGRATERELLQRSLERAGEGHGTAVLIESDEGLGRSRLLDEAILEAKRLGAVVIRADASEGRTPYALVRALASQLYHAVPDLAAQAAAPRRRWLGELAAELTPEAAFDRPVDSEPQRGHRGAATLERSPLNVAARDWFLSIARSKHLVVCVDDIERADETSIAVLAMLAHGAPRRRLNIVLTARRGLTMQSAALALIRSASTLIALAPLAADESAALAQSLLATRPDAEALISQIEHAGAGSPRWIVALAQSIAEIEITPLLVAAEARSPQRDPSELLGTRNELLTRWIASLEDDARDLAQALALATTASVPMNEYKTLTEHRDTHRVHRAVSALERSGLVLAEADHHRFAHGSIASLLLSGIDENASRRLHLRIAEALRHPDAIAERCHHLVLAGDERRALGDLLELPLPTSGLRDLQLTPATLERMLVVALHAETPPSMRPKAQELLLRLAARSGDSTQLLRLAEALDPKLETTQPATESPSLTSALLSLITLADESGDATLLKRLPAFGVLGASLRLVDAAIDVHRALQKGEEASALRRSRELLRLLDMPNADVDPQLIDSIRRRQQYLQGLYAAAQGGRGTLEWLAELERSRAHRAAAWRVRKTYELAHGRLAIAYACEQRAELLALQDGVQDGLPGTSLALELFFVIHAGDAQGLARLRPRAAQLAARSPGFQPIATVADAHALLRDAPLAALDVLTPLLPRLAQRPDPSFPFIATAHVHALRRLGRLAEAADSGARYLDAWVDSGLGPRDLGLRQALAETQLESGRASDARKTSREDLRHLEDLGARGLVLGLARITRARIALALEDASEARAYATRALRDYPGSESPRLTEALAQLRQEAERACVKLDLSVSNPDATAPIPPISEEARALFKRLLACVSAPERAKEGLRLLLEDVGAATGYLFGLRSGRLRCLASTEPREAPADLVALIEDTLRVELEHDGDPALAATPQEISSAYLRFIDDWGREFEPLLLFGRTQGEPVLTGVAALHYDAANHGMPRAAVLDALTEALVAADLIDPITRFS